MRVTDEKLEVIVQRLESIANTIDLIGYAIMSETIPLPVLSRSCSCSATDMLNIINIIKPTERG